MCEIIGYSSLLVVSFFPLDISIIGRNKLRVYEKSWFKNAICQQNASCMKKNELISLLYGFNSKAHINWES